VATVAVSASSSVAGQRFKVLGCQPDCEFPREISLEDFSEVGEAVAT